jgi:hypothetical protein
MIRVVVAIQVGDLESGFENGCLESHARVSRLGGGAAVRVKRYYNAPSKPEG